MNKLKSAVVAGTILMGALCFAQEDNATTTVNGSNELGSDIVSIESDDTKFAGFYNEIIVDVTSPIVDFGIDATAQLSGDAFDSDKSDSSESLTWSFEDFDWYAIVKTPYQIQFGFHDTSFLPGSYLVVEDDNIAGGRIGTNGITVSYTGIENLVIAATLPFEFTGVAINDEGKYQWDYPGLGAVYDFDGKGSFGTFFRSYEEGSEFVVGAYGSFTMIENLAIYAGYATKDNDGLCDISGDNIVNASISYEPGALSVAADFITVEKKFYAGICASYSINDFVTPSFGATANASYDDMKNGTYVLKPCVDIGSNNAHSFEISANITFEETEFKSLCFPVYWKYSF